VAVLLDWIADHPGETLQLSATIVERTPHRLLYLIEQSPIRPLLADLARWGFPVALAMDKPKRMLRMLSVAQARVNRLGQDRCNDAVRDLVARGTSWTA